MMTTLGRERGFPPPLRRSFEAMRGPDGAFFIGEPEAVARKVIRVSEQLGGLSRVTLQMTNIRLQHERLLHSIELLGSAVAPLVRDATA